MKKSIKYYWGKRLADLKEAFEANNFQAFVVSSLEEAKELVLKELLSASEGKKVSWGGSMTFVATGLYHELRARDDLEILDTFRRDMTAEDLIELRRQSLLSDIYITGSNAVTEAGQLVNLDMTGNRVAALAFGPKKVIVLVGRNKICTDLDEAMKRVKDYAAPTNAMRLEKKVPCAKTTYCEECRSADRLCNTWNITEKSYPKGRITVVLMDVEAGL
ncbi:MAG TPA: lactate utilization protein [Desulfobacteraceae bacterium]|nr:lactate utilization protein [Desulfobacteraceae bacterium]